MKRYYSAVSDFNKWMLIASILIVWVSCLPILMGEIDGLFIFIVILVSCFTLFMASIYFNTYYQIKDDKVLWVTGPIKGQLEIAKISQLKKVKSAWEINSLIKPILSNRPLLLRYTKFDDFPVSPRDEQEFIEELLTKNPAIIVEK
ncbi:MAG: PH domain-containing protein [Ekhidna sp.]